MANKYSPKVQRKVAQTMREFKHGRLKMGRSRRKVTSRKQAVAIGISQGRREGGRAPRTPSTK